MLLASPEQLSLLLLLLSHCSHSSTLCSIFSIHLLHYNNHAFPSLSLMHVIFTSRSFGPSWTDLSLSNLAYKSSNASCLAVAISASHLPLFLSPALSLLSSLFVPPRSRPPFPIRRHTSWNSGDASSKGPHAGGVPEGSYSLACISHGEFGQPFSYRIFRTISSFWV